MKQADGDKRSAPGMENLEARLREAEDTLEAIYSGEVDALVVAGPEGDQVFTLKGAEYPYRVFCEEMNEGAVTLTGEGTVLYCNRRFADMVRAPLERVMGSSIYEYVVAGNHRAFEELLREGLMGSAKRELSVGVGERSEVPVYLSASPLSMEGTQAVCLVVTDLTEQKRSEAMVAAGKRRLEEELLKANKLESIGILAGGLAHDLNNSLTAILGNISLAKRRLGADSEQFKRLAEAEAACLQARDVTQQLLTFSTGGAPVRREVSIGPLLREWASFTLAGTNVVAEFRIADDLWSAEIDEGQISRVINNLVINAQQAMPEGGMVTIAAENVEIGPNRHISGLPLRDGKYVKISVRDRGTGISEAHVSKIFDPYFTTKQKGSGLGLSIAYSVTRSHDGYISASSRLGEGSTFEVYLPSTGRQAPEEEERAETAPGGGLRVLVMDDQEAIRELVNTVLTEVEHNVVEFASDGAKALEMYKQAKRRGQPIDVVLMDLTIPGGMGGKEAIRRLKEIDPHAKAIVFSGYYNDPIMADYGKYGFDGVLRKPFEIEELTRALYGVAGGGNIILDFGF